MMTQALEFGKMELASESISLESSPSVFLAKIIAIWMCVESMLTYSHDNGLIKILSDS